MPPLPRPGIIHIIFINYILQIFLKKEQVHNAFQLLQKYIIKEDESRDYVYIILLMVQNHQP